MYKNKYDLLLLTAQMCHTWIIVRVWNHKYSELVFPPFSFTEFHIPALFPSSTINVVELQFLIYIQHLSEKKNVNYTQACGKEM